MERSYSSIRHHHHRHRRDNPSFSSSLLDSIYRSIDDGGGEEEEVSSERDLIFYREAMRNKPHHRSSSPPTTTAPEFGHEKMDNYRRACMIEKWMEKKVAVVRRSSPADLESRSRRGGAAALMNSSSTSSESSSGGGFSSSESESLHRRPKPIRTSVSAPSSASEKPRLFDSYSRHQSAAAPAKQKAGGGKHENSFVKTKSKALKIYGDLKKVKQPISPGGKLATFLNSLFNNAKKQQQHQKPSATSAATPTTCSSASSFSRSCLNHTPSSRGKFSEASSAAAKRSVRFCPVSVIVDEDCRTIGHKSLHDREQALMAVIDDRRRVQEVAIDLLKSYQKKNTIENVGLNPVVQDFDMTDAVVRDRNDSTELENDDDDDVEDDDAASYSSSDLFELDNLSAIGIERYREELPVYETTHFDTNRAIANGFIL